MQTSVLDKVILTLSDLYSIPEDEITLDKSLKDDFGLDSLDEVQIAVALGESLQVDFKEHEFSRIRTVGDLVSVAERIHRNKHGR